MLLLTLVSSLLLVASFAEAGDFGEKVTQEVWFDVEVKDMDGPGDDYRGRFVVALFGEVAPMTALNFASIARGYKRGHEKLHYTGSRIHRIVPDFVIQLGDVTKGDGTGGRSIYGDKFNDEPFALSHRAAGWVAMANHGPDTNGSQFYILLNKARWLDGKHVVFGKVIRGMDVIRILGEVKSDPNTAVPKRMVKVVECGVFDIEASYYLSNEQLDAEEDV